MDSALVNTQSMPKLPNTSTSANIKNTHTNASYVRFILDYLEDNSGRTCAEIITAYEAVIGRRSNRWSISRALRTLAASGRIMRVGEPRHYVYWEASE